MSKEVYMHVWKCHDKAPCYVQLMHPNKKEYFKILSVTYSVLPSVTEKIRRKLLCEESEKCKGYIILKTDILTVSEITV
jgi:hypothetical protein